MKENKQKTKPTHTLTHNSKGKTIQRDTIKRILDVIMYKGMLLVFCFRVLKILFFFFWRATTPSLNRSLSKLPELKPGRGVYNVGDTHSPKKKTNMILMMTMLKLILSASPGADADVRETISSVNKATLYE